MLFYEIVSLVLEVLSGLLTGACLLRLYMQWQRVPFGNPIGRVVFGLTDWLIMPLRRVIPPWGRWDVSSLVAALLLQTTHFLILWLVPTSPLLLVWLPWLAIFGLLRVAVGSCMLLLLAYVLMSWTQNQTQVADLLDRLCQPLLKPWRKLIPRVGGMDWSALVAVLFLQVLLLVIRYLQMHALALSWMR
jgi:YggT family protein